MPRYVLVSYELEDNMPIFKGNRKNKTEKIDAFENGQTWNSFSIKLFNHNGSHIDGPFHFDRKGKQLTDYPIKQFVFNKPLIVDIPREAGEAITADDLSRVTGKDRSYDLLLLRTGFFKKRQQQIYVKNNPWLDKSAADYIRKKYLKMKAIGIDTISIASLPKLAEGGLSHQVLLKKGGYHSSPVMIIEDLNLGAINSRLTRFFAIPLFVRGVDSFPCTAFAEVLTRGNQG